MKQLPILILFLFFLQTFKAQNWCPQGATWLFKFHNSFMMYEDGFYEFKNVAALTVGGKSCNRLLGKSYGTWGPGGVMPLTPRSFEMITYEENGVIFYLTDYERFDTIANFNAAIGQGWYIPDWDTTCGYGRLKLIVTDTGHVTINDINLRKVSVYQSDYPSNYTYDIIERVGSLQGFFYPYYSCELDSWDYLGNFSCYYDDSFLVYSKPGVSDCNFTSLLENGLSNYLKLYPNPNHGKFTLELDQASCFAIHNALGSTVYAKFTSVQGKLEVDIGELPPGVYLVKAQSSSRFIYQKFIKE